MLQQSERILETSLCPWAEFAPNTQQSPQSTAGRGTMLSREGRKQSCTAHTLYHQTLQSLSHNCRTLSSTPQNSTTGEHRAFAFNIFVLGEYITQEHCGDRRGFGSCTDCCQLGLANPVQSNADEVFGHSEFNIMKLH